MSSFLTRPFPFTEDIKKRFLFALGIALFVMTFLYIFRPFGMGNINLNLLLVASGYGAVTLFVTMLTNFVALKLFPKNFNEGSWTVLKEIIYIQIVILIVAAGNLLFTSWLGYAELSFKMFFNSELVTLAVAVLPITILILLKQNILLKRTLKAAQHISKNLYLKERLSTKTGEFVTITAENTKDNLVLEVSCIYFIKSADNYVEVYYAHNNEVAKKLLRTTMRSVQSNLKRFSQFYRCHRAYIVNLEKVKKVTGNAQGYRLILENVEQQILVSRSMNQEISLRLSR